LKPVAKDPSIHTKEPCTPTKETHVATKEPYTPTKELHVATKEILFMVAI